MIAFLSMMQMLAVWQVILIGISLSIATASFDPPSQAIMLDIVAGGDLVKAKGMCQMTLLTQKAALK